MLRAEEVDKGEVVAGGVTIAELEDDEGGGGGSSVLAVLRGGPF